MTFTYNASCNKKYITAGATTQVFSGNGRLVSITFNQATTGTIKLIDGIAGTTANIATIGIGVPAQTLWYNLMIGAGLRIVNSATEDFTVIFILDNQ